jgi:hypothetical protein
LAFQLVYALNQSLLNNRDGNKTAQVVKKPSKFAISWIKPCREHVTVSANDVVDPALEAERLKKLFSLSGCGFSFHCGFDEIALNDISQFSSKRNFFADGAPITETGLLDSVRPCLC